MADVPVPVQAMSDVPVPAHATESQNGPTQGDEKPVEDNLLLRKLVEQNRQLEEDRKFLTHSHPGSTSDSTSMHSADSIGSLRNPTPSHDHRHALSPILSSGTTPSDSPLLHSPTEVRRKPLPSANYSCSDTESDDGSLGPGASIVLDDEYGTRIDYGSVISDGGSSQEVVVSPGATVNRSLSPTNKGLKKKVSTVTSTSDITLILQEDEEDKKVEESRKFESSRVREHTPVHFRRLRSDTESTKRVTLSTLAGNNRKRPMTMIEGGGASSNKADSEPNKAVPERTAEEEQWYKWSELLRNWEESVKKKWSLIKQLAREGIPDPLRGMAWQLLSGPIDSHLKEQYPVLITEDSPFQRAIQRDLNRTFPEHSFFKESDGLGQEGLLNILKAYSIYDREVGYCQGSPFITGLLLMKMPEEEAFCVFVRLMKGDRYRLRDLFKPSMADLSLCFFLLEKFLEDLFPELHTHFRAVGFHTSMYASSWFLTMFASILSLNVVFRIVDIFLVEGREIVFRVGLALIEHNLDRLVKADLEEILKYFQKDLKEVCEDDPDALIQRALKIKISHKKMKKLEKEYLSRKEKEASDGKEIARLQTDNHALSQRVSALEKECASLADRLIQGQVTLAEDAEEKFVLKKKLSVAERRLTTLEKSIHSKGTGSEGVKLVEGAGSEGVKLVEEVESEGVKEGEEKLGPEEHYILVKTSIHVGKEEVEEALRRLDTGSPASHGSSHSPNPQPPAVSPPRPILPTPAETADSAGEIPLGTAAQNTSTLKKKSKLKRRFTNKFKKSKEGDYAVHGDVLVGPSDAIESSPAPSPTPSPATNRKNQRRKKSKSLSGDLTFELAQVKLQCADTALQLESKTLELNKALRREEFLVSELKEARESIMRLEQKLSELSACPQCGHPLQPAEKSNFDLTDSSSASPAEEGADSAILSQVQESGISPVEKAGSNTPQSEGGSGKDLEKGTPLIEGGSEENLERSGSNAPQSEGGSVENRDTWNSSTDTTQAD